MGITVLYKEKTYNGNLNIGQQNISLESDIPFNSIEIYYTGIMRIVSLLPEKYAIQNNSLLNKITIVNKKDIEQLSSDLFSYRGKALISKCILIGYKRYNLYVNKSNLELWNTLRKNDKVEGEDAVVQDWAYLTKNWEDISFDGNNAKRPYIHRKTTYDKDTRTFTTIKEIRKK